MTLVCMIGESDPFIAQLLERFAEKSEMHALGVQVGQDLVELARQFQPAVIILDAELPGTLRGWQAARALKADPATSHIPIISCSWLPELDACTLIGELSAHLQKPELHYEDFLAALQEAGVETSRGSASQSSPSQPDPAG